MEKLNLIPIDDFLLFEEVSEILSERVVNIFDRAEKEKVVDKVWSMLEKTYNRQGLEFNSFSDKNDLMDDSDQWKLMYSTDDGGRKLVGVNVYKKKFGRKPVAIGYEEDNQAKVTKEFLLNIHNTMKNSWAEVSGNVERLMIMKFGTKWMIPSKFAAESTGKHIISYNDDGYHYTRDIGGTPREKVIVGTFGDPKVMEKVEAERKKNPPPDAKELLAKLKSKKD